MRIVRHGLRRHGYKSRYITQLQSRTAIGHNAQYSTASAQQASEEDGAASALAPNSLLNIQTQTQSVLADGSAEEILPVYTRTIAASAVIPTDVTGPKTSEPPLLAHDLSRVLFNPGVVRTQCPRTGVFNFAPSLKNIPPIARFKAEKLPPYRPPSEDPELRKKFRASKESVRYAAATSTCTGVLQHLHYLISNFRPANLSMLSRGMKSENGLPTQVQLGPYSMILKNAGSGQRIMSSDFKFDSRENELMRVGHMLEIKLTVTDEEFQNWLHAENKSGKPPPAQDSNISLADSNKSADTIEAANSFNYLQIGSFLVRSQLDARHPRLSFSGGNGYFDIKTRAVLSVRMDHLERNPEARNYSIFKQAGDYCSFEREMHDLIRTMMLKYSLQARLGQMDGIFLAHHNLQHLLGFQYLSLSDMDEFMHGQRDDSVQAFRKMTSLGSQEMRLSFLLLEHLYDIIVSQFPKQDLWIHFDCKKSSSTSMFVYVEEVDDTLRKEVEECSAKLAEISKTLHERHVARQSQDVGATVQSETDRLVAKSQDLVQLVRENQSVFAKQPEVLGAPELAPMVLSYIRLAADYAELKKSLNRADQKVQQSLHSRMSKIFKAIEQVEAFATRLPTNLQHQAFAAGQAGFKAKQKDPGYKWPHTPKKLLGLRVNLQNFVDGEAVPRPIMLSSKQKWTVKYTVTTLAESTARKQYRMMLNKKIELKNAEFGESIYASQYYEMLQNLSKRGKAWDQRLERRRQQNEMQHRAANGAAASNGTHADQTPASGIVGDDTAHIAEEVEEEFDDELTQGTSLDDKSSQEVTEVVADVEDISASSG